MSRLKLSDLQRRILIELEEIGADEMTALAATADAQSVEEFWTAVEGLQKLGLVEYALWTVSGGKSVYAPTEKRFPHDALEKLDEPRRFRWHGRSNAHVMITNEGLEELGFG
ncbi:MAG: hypothetical protein ACOC9W_01440 [Persicimonas sp.]